FTGANGPVSGRSTETGGKTWTISGSAGTPAITSNALSCPDWTAQLSRAYVNNGVTDGTFSAICANLGAARRARLVFRLTNPAAGSYEIVAGTTSNDHWTLALRNTSGFNVIADLGVASANGDKVAVVMSGSALTVRINDVSVYTGTMTEHLTATSCGFAFGDTDSRWDNASFS
ncbi:hypothetical protein M3484_22290, partial [Pseudomonas sp. GX19020]|uniref:hypothetical protein n=1 Tax=Pseudomonas sp. GX19020 TaxID=2942277 RepID=UPI002018A646